MSLRTVTRRPTLYPTLLERCEQEAFTMPSDLYIGPLLQSLVASKPGGQFLELGTGIGLSLVWMVEGMSPDGRLISIDNDPKLCAIAESYFGRDERVEIRCTDGGQWLRDNREISFDLVFADAWPGKYHELSTALESVKVGGFYLIDDMKKQENWPEGHAEKAANLLEYLTARTDFTICKFDWSTGVVLMVRTH